MSPEPVRWIDPGPGSELRGVVDLDGPGSELRGVGDLDGDGRDDLVATAPGCAAVA